MNQSIHSFPKDTRSEIIIVRDWKSNAFGHGGEKRSFQLESIINNIGQSIALVPPLPDKRPWLQKYDPFNTIKRTLSERNYKLLFRQYKHVKLHSKDRMNEMVLSNPKLKESKVIVWESTVPEYHDFPKLVTNHGKKKIIACPHNLESLIDQPIYYWKEKDKTARLAKEISYLKNCDEVFAIGEEEQWLLQLLGIEAKYLPYYPEGILLETLLKLRHYRENKEQYNSQKKQFLIIGSATNPPTQKGMHNLLDKISKENFSSFTFQVAGFGTDCFSKYASRNIIINGQVSSDYLDQLMLSCDGIIVNQGFSTGSLTKIMEFLVAGIPIICDEGSARSYQRFSGLHCYTTFNKLKTILNDENLKVPFLPERPYNYYESFTKALLG